MTSKVTPVERFDNLSLCEYLEPKFQTLLAKQPSISLLEVGCGTGAFAAILQEKYQQKLVYKAIDPSDSAVEKAKERGVEGLEVALLNDLQAPDASYDIVICTKSFHHVGVLQEALVKIRKLLKPEGLFIADEFAREAVDVPTATFLYGRSDALEDAGKLPVKYPIDPALKHDYLKRWQTKFMPKSKGGTGEAFAYGPFPSSQGTHAHAHAEHASHAHGEHAGHSHSHAHGSHAEHGHSHSHAEHGHEQATSQCQGHKEHSHGAHAGHSHAHGSHAEHGGHSHSHAHAHAEHQGHTHGHAEHAEGKQSSHHHHDSLPTSTEMISEIKTIFPNLQVTPCSFLYHYIAQRFDGSTAGEELVKEFKNEEEAKIASKQIVPIGLRFVCTKQ